MSGTTPTEEQVTQAADKILEGDAGLGIGKLLAQLQVENEWSLSEKRLKNILTQAGLRPTPAAGPADAENQADSTGDAPSSKKKKKKSKKNVHDPSVPLSQIDASVPLPEGLRSHYFGPVKGKGLVAEQDFPEGALFFIEDAYVAAPPGSVMPQLRSGKVCTHCFLPVGGLAVRCSGCEGQFCNRLCMSRGMALHHGILCPGQNPSIKPFLDLLYARTWQSLHIVARMLARILLAHSTDGSTGLDETKSHLDAFATVSELERRARNPGWEVERQALEGALKEAHGLLRAGLDPYEEKRVQAKGEGKKSKWPLKGVFPEDIAKEIFSWETFLRYLGRANINMESHGGMYLVHSQLNHNCNPNVSVRHLPTRQSSVRPATRVHAIALRPISAGEELCISYLDPTLPVSRRQLILHRDYMFGPCDCARCMKELSELPKEERESDVSKGLVDPDAATATKQDGAAQVPKIASVNADGQDRDLSGLEDELRNTLGF